MVRVSNHAGNRAAAVSHVGSTGRMGENGMRRFMALGIVFALAPLGSAMAQAGDPAAGQRVFNQCMACHTINQGGPNRVGPNLHGVIGRKAGAVDGFRYSANMKQLAEGGLTWNDET